MDDKFKDLSDYSYTSSFGKNSSIQYETENIVKNKCQKQNNELAANINEQKKVIEAKEKEMRKMVIPD